MSQKLYNGTGWVEVDWYNEDIGVPKQLYDENYASQLYGYKFLNQQTP